MWKYYSSISQLGFFIFYIIFPFFISLSTIRLIFFFSSTHCPLSLPLFYSPFLPHSPSFIRTFQELFLSPAPTHFFFFFFLLDSKTLSVIRKFSFSSSFNNIPGSSHLRAVAHLRPQPSPDGSAGFCPLSSFFFFFCFYCYDLINFKTVFLSLYSGNLIMLEFRDVWEKDCLLLWFVVFVL